MSRVRSWLTHPWLTVRVQIALGILFVAAALPKIIDPPGFAQMIYNYKMVPPALLNSMALMLPWLELLCGIALILGIWRRTATILTGLMLLTFIAAIGINLARNNPVNCGCFEIVPIAKTPEQLISEMKMVILRDLGMLLMVAQILYATRESRVSAGEESMEEAQPAVAH